MTHDHYSIAIGNESLPIVIRKRRGTRRMVIRYQPLQHVIRLTLPSYASIRQGLRFAEEKRSWIERQIASKPKHIPFADGQVIPMFGKNYTLCHVGGRGVVRAATQPDVGCRMLDVKQKSSLTSDIQHLTSGTILVPGDIAFMPRRLREWLKTRVKAEITQLAQSKAQQIGCPLKKISLRDTSSRWGSCSHTGNLSFSWRLVFAPYAVLDYMVCHEVAHLAEHNHGKEFWALVARLCPEHEKAERWLKTHGATLYAYG